MILASEDMSVFIASLSSFTQSTVGGMHLASFPGSPLAPTKNKNDFYLFSLGRGESLGTRLHILHSKLTSDSQSLGSCAWAAVVWLCMTFEPSLSSSSGIGLPTDIFLLWREVAAEQLCVSVRNNCSLWSREWSRESVGSTETRVCVCTVDAYVSTNPVINGLGIPEVAHGCWLWFEERCGLDTLC